jgi:hypothetical protein
VANLTVTIDDELLRRARLRALEAGTSINAVLREYLEAFAGAQAGREAAVRSLLDLSRKAKSRRGGRTWSREDLHER